MRYTSIRRLLLALLCGAVLAPSAAAAQAQQKELVVIRDYDDTLRFALTLLRTVMLKRSGVDVRVVFQDEAVLAALYFPLPPQKYDEENVEEDFRKERGYARHDYRSGTSGARPRGDARHLRTRLKLDGKLQQPTEMTMATMTEFRALKIPYEVCAFSARVMGVYDQLKEKGEPLSADVSEPASVAGPSASGYAVRVH
jgi:hypothetical protein